MEKKPKGTYKVVVEFNNDFAVVCWKNSKAVNVPSTYCGYASIGKAKQCRRADRRRIDVAQPQVEKF